MRLEHYNKAILAQELQQIFSRYLDMSRYRVFAFGSRVNGKGDDRSDIDIGIEGPEPVPSSALSAIREDVENLPTLYKVDVVDFATVSHSFRDVALQHTESLMPAS